MVTSPFRKKESIRAGPAANPVSTKIPAPIIVMLKSDIS